MTVKLDGLSSGQLLEVIEQAQAAYAVQVEVEAAAAESARQRLLELASRLDKVLGPTQPKSGNLMSLNEACLMAHQAATEKPEATIELMLHALRDVTELARDAVTLGALQAHA